MSRETFLSYFDYNEPVLRRKPSRQPGQDVRDVPTYTIPEAAASLAIPRRTMNNWFGGQCPVLKPTKKYGEIALLSFNDISEAYVLEILRTVYGFPLQSLRQVVENAKRETKLKRPLIDGDLTVVFSNLVFEKPARGKQPRRFIDLAHYRNLVFPELVDILGKRVLRDRKNSPYRLYPWRLLRTEDDSQPITIDPKIMSGRAVITGTRVPVSALVGLAHSGKTAEQIATSYNLNQEVVRKAIQHIERPLSKVA